MFKKDEDKKTNFNIKISVSDAKKLLDYLDGEFMPNYDEFLEEIEGDTQGLNEELQHYNEIRDILVDFMFNMESEINKKESFIIKNSSEDKKEHEVFKKRLSPSSNEILKNILLADKTISPITLYKFYWYLHSLHNKNGEIFFTENSLESLLGIERRKSEKFLEKLSKAEILFDNKSAKFIKSFKMYGDNVVRIDYNLSLLIPEKTLSKNKKTNEEVVSKLQIKKK